MTTKSYPRLALFRFGDCRSFIPILAIVLLVLEPGVSCGLAQAPRILPAGTRPNDIRLQPLKDLDGYFPFHPAKTPAEWAPRAERVRRQMLVALGLWPMPAKTPLNAVIHGKIARDNYTVEKVYFESYPGFFVTGSLYRPRGKSGKVPGVLSPHGHWENGRFYDQGPDAVRKEIAGGAERFEEGGRSPLQARCVQLARMGCVVFHYDMIGYADSVQISQALAHRFAIQRPEMNTVENWGLFSPQAEAHLQSVMGLQTWNSIRALDFLLSLPDVDVERIGVTGASGGGTQTFILGALDSRPAAAFPAVMVSTAMQGGCTCENAGLLRIETGNVEFAALFAPKPLGMTAANDWTKEMPAKGFPELKEHYAMMGAPDHVLLKPLLQFGHNYNYVSRAAMYDWFNRFLKLECPDPVLEQDYRRLTATELSVWDENHPQPKGGPDFERHLLRYLTEQTGQQLEPVRDSIAHYREVVGGAVDAMIGRNFAGAGEVEFKLAKKTEHDTYREMTGLLRNQTHDEELPVLLLHPKQPQNRTVIWIDPAGKAGLFDGDRLSGDVQKLLAAGTVVVGVDLLEQGEFLADGQPIRQTRRGKNPREFGGYTFGYNHALLAQRVHDILTVIKYSKNKEHKNGTLTLVGLGGAGPWVAAALAQARAVVSGAVVDTGGFRFGKILDLQDINFLPGGARYGDLPGIMALGAPVRLWVAGEGDRAPEVMRAMYAQAGAEKNLTLFNGDRQTARQAAIEWLLREPGN